MYGIIAKLLSLKLKIPVWIDQLMMMNNLKGLDTWYVITTGDNLYIHYTQTL